MNVRVKLLLLLFFCSCGYVASAQQINIGLHLNPAFTVPVFGRTSIYDSEIKVSDIRVGYNAGLNIGFTRGKINAETGVNIVQKSIAFRNSTKGDNGDHNAFRVIANSTSYEFPLLAAVNIHHHDKNELLYDLYLTGGLSYELFRTDGYVSQFSSQGSGGTTLRQQEFEIPKKDKTGSWMNIAFGFKINTIIENFGLIDYGLTWHIPMSEIGPYHLVSDVLTHGTNKIQTYKGDFYPRMSYLDVKLCYYFLNYTTKFKRIKYSKGEYLDF